MKLALELLVRQQQGYFTAKQALAAGYSYRMQNYHARNGNWKKIDRAIYRLTGYPDSMESRFVYWFLWSGKYAKPEQVAISHQSALAYYGLSEWNADDAPVHLTVPQSTSPRGHAGGCVLHRAALDLPNDVNRKGGFNITTPERTLRDLKPDLVLQRKWGETVQQAHARNLIDRHAVEVILADLSGHAVQQIFAGAGKGEQMAASQVGAWASSGSAVPDAGSSSQRSLVFRRVNRSGFLGNRSAFTLVELLVVVSIIAILASLLLPVLGKAVGTARQTQCANNLRQLHLSFQYYANDFNGTLATHQFAWIYQLRDTYPDQFPPPKMWSAGAAGRQVWHCPACPRNSVSDTNSNGASDYGNNSQWSKLPNETNGTKIAAVAPRPSEKFMLADIGFMTRPTLYPVYPDRMMDALQHDARLNMLFFDGHVTSRSDPYNICRWTSWGGYNGAADKRPFNTSP